MYTAPEFFKNVYLNILNCKFMKCFRSNFFSGIMTVFDFIAYFFFVIFKRSINLCYSEKKQANI